MPTPNDAAAFQAPLTGNFSRFIVASQVDPKRLKEFLAAALDAQDTGDAARLGPIWEPLRDKVIGNQVQFFLQVVQDYWRGRIADSGVPTCTGLTWREPVTKACGSKVRVELRKKRDARSVLCLLNAVESYVFASGMVFTCIELEAEQVDEADDKDVVRSRAPLALDLMRLNYALRRPEPGLAARVHGERRAGQLPPPLVSGLHGLEGATLAELADWSWQPAVEASGAVLQPAHERALRILSYAAVGPTASDEEMLDLAYHLRRVSTEAYVVGREQRQGADEAELERTFEGILFGAAMEGLAVVVRPTGHDFYNEFPNRVRRSYFAHYLLAMHQRAALLDLAVRASRLPSLDRAKVQRSRDVEDLRKRVVEFNLRHRYSQVSNLSAYAHLYERLCLALALGDLRDEVRDEVREVDELLRRGAEQESALSAKRLNWLASVFASVAVLVGLFGSNLPPYRNPGPEMLRSPWLWGPVLVLVAVLLPFSRLLRSEVAALNTASRTVLSFMKAKIGRLASRTGGGDRGRTEPAALRARSSEQEDARADQA